MAHVNRRYAIIEAPSSLGLTSRGVDRLPQALLGNGLRERLDARYAGRVEPPPHRDERDGAMGTLNARAIADWSPRLADAFGRVLDDGEFPVVLGGDCSILLGTMLALKRRGRFGLLFIDGHADFYQPAANPNGEVASMDLAFATGYGPALLTDLEHRGPLVRPADTVAFGFRDADEQRQYGSQPLATDILAVDLAAVRQMSVELAARAALDRLTGPEIEGFFIHLDADCLDDRIMPAVDYRLPDGLSWSDALLILKRALASGRAVGMEITIYNPALDEDGKAGRELTDLLVTALGTSAPSSIVDALRGS